MAFGDVVQSNSGTSTLATTSPTLGSGVTSGNLIVLTFAADDYNGTPDSGWTQSSEMEQQTFHGGYIWWFLATSNGQTIPPYTIGSAVRSNWHLVEYEGPFDSSPYDVSEGQFQQTSTNSYTTANMTPTAGDRLMVVGMNFQHATSDLGTPGTWLGSFSQVTSTVYNGGNPRLAIGQARRVVTANGSTAYSSGATLSTSQVAQSKSGLIIAFKKGASGTSGTVPAATITLAGVVPTAAPDAATATTPAADLTIAGVVPEASLPANEADVPPAVITITAETPTAALGDVTATVPPGELSTAAVAPTVTLGAATGTVPTATITLGAVPPASSAGDASATVPPATTTITGIPPASSAGTATAEVPQAALTITGIPPEADSGATPSEVAPAALTITAVTPTPSTSGTSSATVPTAAITLLAVTPAATITGDASAEVPAATVTVEATTPTTSTGSATAEVPTGQLSIDGITPIGAGQVRLRVAGQPVTGIHLGATAASRAMFAGQQVWP